MIPTRRGFSLLELLVALPLVALLGVVAVSLLLNVHHQVIGADGALSATRELRHGASILAAEWRGLRAVDVVAWTDTSFEFDGTVGIGVVCSSSLSRSMIAVVGADPSDSPDVAPMAMGWNQPLQTGDRATVWLPGAWPLDSLRSADARVNSSTASADCSQSPLVLGTGKPTLRMVLADTLPSVPVTGTPVRITRRTRYSLYRSSDGNWYLGRRTRGASGWDVIQPVAGPLQMPRDRGLRIAMYDSTGGLLPPAATSGATTMAVARISAQLQAPRRAGRANAAIIAIDSLTVDVALRIRRAALPASP